VTVACGVGAAPDSNRHRGPVPHAPNDDPECGRPGRTEALQRSRRLYDHELVDLAGGCAATFAAHLGWVRTWMKVTAPETLVAAR
jgi:hypothetical protein